MEQQKRIDNLNNKLLNATGKYSDYRRYWGLLSTLDDQYDETLEIYNQDIWWGNSDGTIREKAAHMLRVTEKLFRDMMENAETELVSVVEEIMDCDEAEQKQIWGKDIFLDKKIVEPKGIKDELLEWEEYPYAQSKALEYFVKIVGELECNRL